MPYDVLSPMVSCSDLHGAHRRFKDAIDCLEQIIEQNGGDIPVNPLTGKYMHAVAAVDETGAVRDFGSTEKRWARESDRDQRYFWIKKPNVTTILNLARLHYESCRLIPMLSIDLKGLFDNADAGRHFWNTDAGKGQSIAYIVQTAFSLELSLKAIQEACGNLVRPINGGRPDWEIHPPAQLFRQLDDPQQIKLEQLWKSLSDEQRRFDGSYFEFLRLVDGLYLGVRYFDKGWDANRVQVDLSSVLCASGIALEVAFELFRKNAPVKPNVTITTSPDATQSPVRSMLLQGVVRSVNVPEGFDPHVQVEVVVEPSDGGHTVTALFRKSDVENYWGLVGLTVRISGRVTDAEPRVLFGANHLDREDLQRTGPAYTTEFRTLKGTIFDVQRCELGTNPNVVRLILDDATFFAKVECLFSTDSEKAQLSRVHLGDEILVSGQVSLMNGRPMVLIGPAIFSDDNDESESAW